MFRPLAALALLATPALADPVYVCEYDDDVDAAAIVIQFNEQVVTRTGLGECQMTGRIIRVFRGDIPLGAEVRTKFGCVDEAVEPSTWGFEFDPAMVAAAGAIELHSAGGGTGPSGNGAGLVLLDAPTDTIARDQFCN